MPSWKRLSIDRKLPALIAGLLLVVVVVFTAGSYREVRRVALRVAAERLQRVTAQLGELLAASTRRMLTEARGLAGAPQVGAFLRSPGPATRARALDTLQAYTRRSNNLYGVEVWDAAGRRVLATDSPPPPPALGPAFVASLRAAVPADSHAVIGPLLRMADSVEFAVVGAVVDGPRPLGYVVQRRRLSSGASRGSAQLAQLIGSESEILIGNTAGDLWTDFSKPVATPRLPAERDVPLITLQRPDGAVALARVVPIAASPWSLLIEFPQAPVLASAQRYLVRASVLAAILLVAGVLGGWVVSRRITRPLRAVTEAAEAIARSEPVAAVAVTREDELGRLAASFNVMAAHVAESRHGLEAAVERYRLLFEENPLPMWLFDPATFAFLDVNQAAIRAYGYSRDEFLKMTIADIRPPEDVPRLRAVTAAAKDGIELSGRWRHLRKDGSPMDVEVTRHRVTVEGRAMSLAAVHDVTARHAAERALRESEDALRQLNAELEQRVADRTAALTAANRELEAFSYSVSHDLRAPLRAIDGFSRMLAEDHASQLSAEARRLLGVVRSNTQQMGNLIDDLLAFARLGRQSLTLAPVDMTKLARGVAEDVRHEAGDGAGTGRGLEIAIADLPAARGDRTMLKQVFSNLLQNGVKFSRGRKPARIEVGHRTIDGTAAYYVRDNGVGYDPRYADKLFGVFQRLHRAEEFEGTGVGLAIVHRIITRHGGRVWAEGAINQGATFYFTLPGTAEP